MMIANRESFAAAARKRLPYDAEVEYLGFDGAQYIDTGIAASGEFAMDMELMISRIDGNTIYAGARSATEYLHVPQVVSATAGSFVFYYGGGMVTIVSAVYPTLNVRYATHAELTRTLRLCTVNGQVVARDTTTISPTTSDLPIYVGKRSFYGSSDTVRAMVGRLYRFQLVRNGTNSRDMIPVRVGSGSSAVGYMFDRVSGTLFGNAGTGSFAIGPDKTA